MELQQGQVAVVTGGGSGIGAALAERFAQAGLHIVLADVDEAGMAATSEALTAAHGIEVLTVPTDVRDGDALAALAQQTVERFGGVQVLCNNAGVATTADPWFGPFSAWEWVIGVNLFGVVHGCRAFLPHLIGGGHIVNTASIAGLMPGFAPSYDASKHAVVAVTEDLYNMMQSAGLPIGVSVLCPGWVRTNLLDSERHWPADFGDAPDQTAPAAIMQKHVARALDEGATPAAVADAVFDAVSTDRFWVIPHQEFFDIAIERWDTIRERQNPQPPEHVPGMPPRSELMGEILTAMLNDLPTE